MSGVGFRLDGTRRPVHQHFVGADAHFASQRFRVGRDLINQRLSNDELVGPGLGDQFFRRRGGGGFGIGILAIPLSGHPEDLGFIPILNQNGRLAVGGVGQSEL